MTAVGVEEPRTILVVGDWVIDEYWFLEGHRHDLSSHIGDQQYRVSSNPEEVVRNLCAAGHVARVLFDIRASDQSKPFNLVGAGAWDEGDTDLIQHLLHECDLAKAKYRFRLQACGDPPAVQLISLDSTRGTTKVIRLYLDYGRKQPARIDWAMDAEGSAVPIRAELLPKVVNPILVICDNKKGVINKESIAALQELYPGADWYVRSKEKDPTWLTDEIAKKIKLLMIGPEVATKLNPVGHWLNKGKITLLAREILDSIKAKSVVLISQERHVLGRLGRDICVTAEPLRRADEQSPRDPAAEVGWTSAVFGSLIHTTFDEPNIAFEHIRDAVARADPQRRRAGAPSKLLVDHTWENRDWTQEIGEWDSALRDSIEGGTFTRLDLWRASTDLPGYIACIEEKRRIIREIGGHLRAFRDGRRLRPMSILLTADPGAGKTSLARSLARAFDFQYVGRDLTQMTGRKHLLDLFDEVVAHQWEGDNVLVFVDEINAPLGSGSGRWYSFFLSLLEEGVLGGRLERLKPAAWLFAGTELDSGDKLADFESRITITQKLNYKSLEQEAIRQKGEEEKKRVKREARAEQLYLGATMVKHFHPGVRFVAKEVLERFYLLDPAGKSPAREIRKSVALLRNVQFAKVSKDNWGEDWDEGQRAVPRWPNGSEPIELVP